MYNERDVLRLVTRRLRPCDSALDALQLDMKKGSSLL